MNGSLLKWRRAFALNLTALMLFAVSCSGVCGTAFAETVNGAAVNEVTVNGVTQAPASSDIYIYNNYNSNRELRRPPAVYVSRVMTEGSVVRVYDSASGGNLLGSGQRMADGPTTTVTLNKSLTDKAGTLYISVQEPGKDESSRTAASYTRRVNPNTYFKWYKFNSSQDLTVGSTLNITGTNELNLKAGDYCTVEIMLREFVAIDGMTLPLHYDPNYLELAKIVSRGGGYALSSTETASAPEGTTFEFSTAENMNYGILAGGADLNPGDGWRFVSKNGGEYQYVNTSTGVIKYSVYNELGTRSLGDIGAGDSGWSAWKTQKGTVLKLYFKVKQDVKQSVLRFAVKADCPEEYLNSATEARKYYDVANPDGLSVSIGNANVLMSAPILEEGQEVSDDRPLTLSEEQLADLSTAMTAANLATSVLLPENSVKVYNYTNSNPFQALDMEEDALVIQASGDLSGAQMGDLIKVYELNDKGEYVYQTEGILGEGSLGTKPISLGSSILRAEGGTIFVTVTRNSQESEKIRVDYPKEVRRNVFFRIYRGNNKDYTGQDISPDTGTPSLMNDVKKGEKIQLRIYFNDIRDLLTWSFPIHFDSAIVSMADNQYQAVPSGYIPEDKFINGTSGLSMGMNLRNITFNDLLIYNAAEMEIPSVMAALGITDRAEFDRRKKEVQLKLQLNVDDYTKAPWKGGLIFTPRPGQETTSFPYVDNEKGLIKLMMATLTGPMLTLEQDGGYHFLSINFVGKANGNPDFRFARENDPAYDPTNVDGGIITIATAEENESRPQFTSHWQVFNIKDGLVNPTVFLHPGNTLAEDLFPDIPETQEEYELAERLRTAVHVYDGCGFRDPGIDVVRADGSDGIASEVRRYYLDEAGQEVELPAYTSGEAIWNFKIRSEADGTRKSTDEYTLFYEYKEADSPSYSAVVSRKIYVIPRRGDVNGDGKVNNSDRVALLAHANGTQPLPTTDLTYVNDILDVNRDGVVDEKDAVRIDLYNKLGAVIENLYPVDPVERVMTFDH